MAQFLSSTIDPPSKSTRVLQTSFDHAHLDYRASCPRTRCWRPRSCSRPRCSLLNNNRQITLGRSALSNHVKKAALSAPKELLATRRLVREIHASTDTVAVSPFQMFEWTAIIKWASVQNPSGRFAQAASAAVDQTDEDASETMHISHHVSTC